MVVTSDEQDAVVFGSSGVVHVLEYVDASVHARAFAIPEAEYPGVGTVAKQVDFLAAPDRSGGEFLVDAGHKAHVVRLKVLAGFPQGFVETAEW